MGEAVSGVGSDGRRQRLAGDSGAVVVDVAGQPRTKGSLKPIHIRGGAGSARCRVSLTESGEYSIAWKERMIAEIRARCACERYAGPVTVSTFFRFSRVTKDELIPDGGLTWPVRAAGPYAHGDEDKLRRNVLDALTQSGLIADDALVVGGQSWKRYAEDGESGGVMVVVERADFATPGWLRGYERDLKGRM